jgi:multicomponent Na+:H+ antiporter subunit G
VSAVDLVVVALLAAGVGIQLLCCVGLLVAREVFDRLHFVGPATTLAPLLIAVAIVAREGFSIAGNKSLLVAILIMGTSPSLTIATARAARVRQFDHWRPFPNEIVRDR